MKLKTLIQYLLPHHLLSRLIGYLAKCHCSWLKNFLIDGFIKHYKVNMNEAIESNPHKYENFNDFFSRALKPETRSVVQGENEIACPIDGLISQIGKIENKQLIQAKGFKFDVKTLLSDVLEPYSAVLNNGHFATLYLSPRDYHRVHMPLTGKLMTMVHVPGRLFSVNPLTVKDIPNLFTRNERVVTIFETEFGPMAIVLVGAMLVASIATVWAGEITPLAEREIRLWDYKDKNIELKRGQEMGRFQFGSTVILLFAKDTLEWQRNLFPGSIIKMGQSLGKVILANARI